MSVVNVEPESLKLMMADISSASEGALSNLFDETPGIGNITADDTHYIRQMSEFNVADLQNEISSLTSSLYVVRRQLESQLAGLDRSALPSVDSVEGTISQDLRMSFQTIRDLEISPTGLEISDSLKVEKQALRDLIRSAPDLQEFIEIPQLISDCIKREYLPEAFSLCDFFERTCRQHALTETEIFMELGSQVSTLKEALVATLEDSLRSKTLKLQEVNDLFLLFQVMFPTSDLKAKFLEVRSQFIAHRRGLSHDKNPEKRVKNRLDLIRVHLSELVIQYKSLFGSEIDPGLTRLVVSEVDAFVQLLNESLGLIESPFQFLSEVYQIISFVKLFHINPILDSTAHQCLTDRTDKACRETLESFKIELSSYNWKPFQALVSEETDLGHVLQLTRHKPIAVLYNDIMNMLNDLRLFRLKSAFQPVSLSLDRLLYAAFELLNSFPSAPSSELGHVCRNFCAILTPLVEDAVRSIFAAECKMNQLRHHPRFVAAVPIVSPDLTSS
jgi:hypothetical protein